MSDKESVCPVCGAGGNFIGVISSVEDALPSPEVIAAGMMFKMHGKGGVK